MSDPSRKRELSKALDRELKLQADIRGRLTWLANQLVEYVDRFSGFATVGRGSTEAAVRGDLFSMVQIAAERLMTEVGELSGAADVRSACTALQDSLHGFERDPQSQSLAGLHRTVEAVRVAIGELHAP